MRLFSLVSLACTALVAAQTEQVHLSLVGSDNTQMHVSIAFSRNNVRGVKEARLSLNNSYRASLVYGSVPVYTPF